jgi:subtilase family serine protease
MSWTVKRSTANGGPYSIIVSNLTQASWRDASFTPNVTYYYVVSAVNAFGESPNSAQVSAQPTNGLPDVVITSVSWTPANVLVGSNMVFRVTVRNQGSAPTPSGVTLGVGFNMDGAGTVSWSSGYSSALAANASVLLTADGGPSGVNYWTATAGPHTVVATVDDVNRIAESIEDNNATNVSFFVTYPRPKITAISVTNGNAILTWGTVVGGHYQAQFKNDLSQANWNDLGNSIAASGSSLSVTNGVSGAGQTYYRVVVN